MNDDHPSTRPDPEFPTRRGLFTAMAGFAAAGFLARAPAVDAETYEDEDGCDCVPSKMKPAPISARREQLHKTMKQMRCLQDFLQPQ